MFTVASSESAPMDSLGFVFMVTATGKIALPVPLRFVSIPPENCTTKVDFVQTARATWADKAVCNSRT
jgi:hypothetical protein